MVNPSKSYRMCSKKKFCHGILFYLHIALVVMDTLARCCTTDCSAISIHSNTLIDCVETCTEDVCFVHSYQETVITLLKTVLCVNYHT